MKAIITATLLGCTMMTAPPQLAAEDAAGWVSSVEKRHGTMVLGYEVDDKHSVQWICGYGLFGFMIHSDSLFVPRPDEGAEVIGTLIIDDQARQAFPAIYTGRDSYFTFPPLSFELSELLLNAQHHFTITGTTQERVTIPVKGMNEGLTPMLKTCKHQPQ